MNGWDECIRKLRLSVVACQNAQDKSDECLAECHKMNEAIAKLQENHQELKATLCQN
jgi:hypothetical protein